MGDTPKLRGGKTPSGIGRSGRSTPPTSPSPRAGAAGASPSPPDREEPRLSGAPQRIDPLSPEARSAQMRRVRSKDTGPELVVRRLVHSMGYRFRLHSKTLPGHPDLVFAGRRKVIFVHGCFWHRHEGCPRCRMPKSRVDFWRPKLEGNQKRDQANQLRLRELGWDYLVIWECQLKDVAALAARIREFLG